MNHYCYGIAVVLILSLNFKMCADFMCSRAEYQINGECCPTCPPGAHVYRHCSEDTSTTCVSCPPSTYIDKPNGLDKCFPCMICDAGQGLREKTSCTRISNTFCEPLEGYYCADKSKEICRNAKEHTKCKPGQYIKQRGTPSTDTICDDCTDGTYSNGSSSSCVRYTECKALGLQEIKPGTATSDSECAKTHLTEVLLGALIPALVLVSLIILLILKFKKRKTRKKHDANEEVLPIVLLNKCLNIT